ncbi:queuosine precursor transporter [Sphaerochaeta sp. S2]|uniref:queuosine precursor transporter n=1 Tax=Sphaerochaeta sp. S2 TaxID=2798868 RepID=UPI0018E93671|nr:queuosine precursor transporter [Sphaerochaeta sp. S2]MBJ2356214.1 queuosine precursor transporter [Sphaerochaeta sp. S2]MCK9347393.1 queuosine precursor transporter [Sphaerochaeta sp.]MDY0244257.1 queuosine precursor transporter [Sphaerochaeta sp.]
MNELFWMVMLALNFVMILIAFRLWGKLGLYIWIPISVIVANIQVTKNVMLFGLDATLGNIVYATGFLATDILSELYGKKESAKAVAIGFFSLLAMTIIMQVALLFEPAASDIAHSSLSLVFGLMPRIAFGSLVAYVISNLHDIWAFDYWKRKRPGNRTLWLRNNLSTIVSQLIDTLVFTFIAFWGVYPTEVLTGIVISTYLLKWVVAVMDTPFMYLARFWYDKDKIPTPSL